MCIKRDCVYMELTALGIVNTMRSARDIAHTIGCNPCSVWVTDLMHMQKQGVCMPMQKQGFCMHESL